MILSIIVPCYNEEKVLPNLISEISNFKNIHPEVEFIIVNNGSIDKTGEILNSNVANKLFKVVNVEINKGYGHGIKSGLKNASCKYIGWFHADNLSIFNFLNSLLNQEILKNDKIYIKGLRDEKRGIANKLFTFFLSLCSTIILACKLNDINAQPTIFENKLFLKMKNAPDDFAFDLYTLYFATKNRQKILRIKHVNYSRQFGNSSWNIGILSRINLSIKYLNYILFKIKR